MLGVLPQDLDSVKFGAVGRQIVQIQAMLGPLAPLFVYRGALVYAGVVNQDDSGNLVRLSRNVVDERDDVATCRRPLLRGPGQRAIVTQCPKHVNALPMCERFNGAGLALLNGIDMCHRVPMASMILSSLRHSIRATS